MSCRAKKPGSAACYRGYSRQITVVRLAALQALRCTKRPQTLSFRASVSRARPAPAKHKQPLLCRQLRDRASLTTQLAKTSRARGQVKGTPLPCMTDCRNRGMRTRLGCLSHKSDSCSDFTAILLDKPNRALKRLSTEEASRWADSFDVLLSHKYGVAAFRAFLKTEFSEENLEFWLACEEFKKTRSTAKLASKAQRIFEEFIDVQAPRELTTFTSELLVTGSNIFNPYRAWSGDRTR
ncbi:regulator of G-protein signaling 8 isoform X6 [Hemicordylus capensis]|uniref:regulator of G-protein signaling 8 isoform X6 n=1 Tax=Hemicordylus capensis TaxID=884348 RepID=UPI0023032064|nr:regulator of G-protein signaling 8 isoform X6 [Hemicordylus capensis]